MRRSHSHQRETKQKKKFTSEEAEEVKKHKKDAVWETSGGIALDPKFDDKPSTLLELMASKFQGLNPTTISDICSFC